MGDKKTVQILFVFFICVCVCVNVEKVKVSIFPYVGMHAHGQVLSHKIKCIYLCGIIVQQVEMQLSWRNTPMYAHGYDM